MSSITIIKCDHCNQEILNKTTAIRIIPANLIGTCWDGDIEIEHAKITFNKDIVIIAEHKDFCDYQCFINWLRSYTERLE